ncbi:MAG: DUF2721 domain-containing protein [Muribaculaceae bacterium]|nr:DUF2721 domain-containing protein [Muribaculaceae bacterium]
MEDLNLITPTLLFSAVSLISLAYTNRFLSYAQLVRNLKDQYMIDHSKLTQAQIANLNKRLILTRNMQIFGVASLLLCVITMLLVFISLNFIAKIVFAVALVLFIISLALSVLELMLSTKALKIYLSDMQ